MASDLSFVGFAETDDPDAVCRFGEAQDVQPVICTGLIVHTKLWMLWLTW
jgi:hypothetical protein